MAKEKGLAETTPAQVVSVQTEGISPAIAEKLLIEGDLAKLSVEDRVKYYMKTCAGLGLNPMTRPFEYIILNGKMALYARKDCTEQLRKIHGVSITIEAADEKSGVFVVRAAARDSQGRTDSSLGAVALMGNRGDKMTGDALANAMMKAETKAKRRVTLSICGLGMLDEVEVETIKDAQRVSEDYSVAPVNAPVNAPVTFEEVKALAKATDPAEVLAKPQERPTSEVSGPAANAMRLNNKISLALSLADLTSIAGEIAFYGEDVKELVRETYKAKFNSLKGK